MLLAMTACHTPVETRLIASQDPMASPLLIAVDSLMWRQPDSALTLLLPWFDTVHTNETFNNHYGNLLLAELLYKNDYAQANRRELKAAVAYFDSIVQVPELVEGPSKKPKVFLCARAHYINGIGYYEQDSVVEACREYIRALEIMESHFDEQEMVGEKVNFMAMTYTRLTVIFSKRYLNKQAVYFGKLSLPYYEKSETSPWQMSWMLCEIGAQYSVMEELDSAGYYYQRAMSNLPDTTGLMYRDIVSRQAFLSYMQDKTSFASLKQLFKMLAYAESEKEKMSRCLTIGEIFYHEKQYDSAWVFLEKVFCESNSILLKKQAAEWLVEICKKQDRNSESFEYAEFLVPFANLNENQGALKSQLTELCYNYEQSKQETLHQEKVKKLLGWGGLVLAIVAILVTIMVISYFVDKKQRGHLEAQKEETEEKLRTTIQEHIKELEEKDLALDMAITEERQKAEKSLKAMEIQHSAVLGKAKSTIRHLQETNRMLNERKGQEDIGMEQPKALKEEYDALMREGLCINIKQRLKKADAYTSFDTKDYSSLALSSKELSELIQVIDKHCPDFSRRLKKQYPKLNSNDIQLCRLYLLNLKVLQAAILLGTDYSSVRKRTNRLKGKIGSEELCLQLKSTFFEGN